VRLRSPENPRRPSGHLTVRRAPRIFDVFAALIEIAHRIAAEPAAHGNPPPMALQTLKAKYGSEMVIAVVSYGSAMLATNRLNTTLGIPIDDDLLPTPEATSAPDSNAA